MVNEVTTNSTHLVYICTSGLTYAFLVLEVYLKSDQG